MRCEGVERVVRSDSEDNLSAGPVKAPKIFGSNLKRLHYSSRENCRVAEGGYDAVRFAVYKDQLDHTHSAMSA